MPISTACMTAANPRVGNELDGIAQTIFTDQSQSVGQTTEQIRAIGFAQRDDNGSSMVLEGKRNGMEEIAIGGHKHGVALLRFGKKAHSSRNAGRKKL